jgi:uncharacterized delta-60 repeat protein
MLYFSQIKPQAWVACALLFFLSFFGYSQKVQVDPNFNTFDKGLSGSGFDKEVDKIISLPDGGYIAFGSFTQFNGIPVNGFVKLTAKGELDLSFNTNQSGPDNTVKDVVVLPDRKLLVTGNFVKYNGVTVNRLIRLNFDGTLDTSFALGTGFNFTVYSIAVQPDGKILAAGSFSKYNGLAVNKVIRLYPNGDLDSSFAIGTNPNDTPNLLLLQTDGKVLVGGDFTTFDGKASSKLIRLNLNGSVDSSFSIGTGFSSPIYAMALQKDGKIVIGGSFSTFNGQSIKRIVRLNTNGSQDSSFISGTGFSNGTVRSIVIQTNGKMLVGGSFSGNYNGTIVKRMIQILPNGNYDSTFSILPNGQLNSISLFQGGAIIGGDFNLVSEIQKNRMAKLLFCQEETIWNGTSWSNGLPTAEKAIVFTANYDLLQDTKACTCSLNLGVTVKVATGVTLELGSNYSGSGNLIFENSSSFYQTDDSVVNTGNIQFKRKTSPVTTLDYTYWASPVVGQQLQLLSPNSPMATFYSFNTYLNNWNNEQSTTTMDLGKGYIFQAPSNFSATIPSIFEAVFSGVPNNGLISLPIEKSTNPILIGNPYPSALDANAFILENQKLLQGSLYFWTHNTSSEKGQYMSDDYAVYTLFGGVGTAAKNNGINNSIPTGKIASGQAFFALGANEQGSVVFKNAMRIKGNNNQFFKNENSLKTAPTSTFEKHRIWLNLSNSKGLFKQTLLGYASGATNGQDLLFDGISLDSNEELDFYSVNATFKNSIQARALPFDDSDFIPIGFRVKQEGNYTISLDDLDGLFTDQTIYVEDQKETKIQNLKKGGYTFTTSKGTFDNRLVLRFKNPNEVAEKITAAVQVVTSNNQIQISTTKDKISSVALFSIDGKQLFQARQLNTKTHSIESALWKSKVIIIQITLETGEKISRKLLF